MNAGSVTTGFTHPRGAKPTRWFRSAGWTGRNTLFPRWGSRASSATAVLITVSAVQDLVERVLGASPLPRDDNDVALLLVGLRRQLPHLEQLLGATAPDLVRQARRIRDEPVPEGRMPVVILTIRLAEIAHALISALPENALPRRTDAQDALPPSSRPVGGRQDVAEQELTETGPMPLPAPARTPAPSRPRSPSQHRSSRAAELVSAAAGSLGDCGPPA